MPRPSPPKPPLLLALLLLLFPHPALPAPAVPPGYKPLWTAKQADALCTPPGSFFAFNALLPAGPGASDLGALPLFDCPVNGTCAYPALPALSVPALLQLPWFVLGAAALALLHVAAAALLVVGTGCCLCGRYGCGLGYRLVRGKWPVTAPLCCAPYPTLRGKRSVTGFADLGGGKFGYAPRVVLRTRVCLVGLLALLLGLVVSSYTAGSVALTANLLLAADPSVGLGKSVRGLVAGSMPPTQALLLGLADGAVGGLLRAVNASLTAPGLSLPAAVRAMRCMNASLAALPDAGAALALVNSSIAALGNIEGNATVLVGAVSNLVGQRSELEGYAVALTGNLTRLGSGLSSAAPPLALAAGAATAMVPLAGALRAPGGGSGLLVDAAAGLAAAGAFWPAASDVAVVVGASPASFTPAQLPAWVAAAGARDVVMPAGALAGALSTLLTAQLLQMPNLTATAGALEGINAAVANLSAGGGPLEALAAALFATAGALEGIPPYATLADSLDALNRTINAVTFSGAVAASEAIASTLAALPDFGALSQQLVQLGNLSAVLPCAATLVAQLGAMNETLYQLPAELDSVGELVGMLNDTAKQSMLGDTALSRFPLLNASAYVGGFNGTALRGTLAALADSVVARRDALNLPLLYARLGTLNATLGAVPSARLRAYANATLGLRDALSGSLVNASDIAQLRALQGAVNTALSLAALGLLEYRAQALGHCNSTFNFCGSDGDCASGGARGINLCNASAAGLKRCANNWFPRAQPQGWWLPGAFAAPNTTAGTDTTCRGDADCQPTELCVGDPARAAALALALNATAAAKPNVTA